MTRRFFWQVPEFIKYRTVFEDKDVVLGKSETGEHRLFRKDTGRVCFDERLALLRRVTALAEDDPENAPLPPQARPAIRSRLSYLH